MAKDAMTTFTTSERREGSISKPKSAIWSEIIDIFCPRKTKDRCMQNVVEANTENTLTVKCTNALTLYQFQIKARLSTIRLQRIVSNFDHMMLRGYTS